MINYSLPLFWRKRLLPFFVVNTFCLSLPTYIHNISPLAISKQIHITSHPINHCPLRRTSTFNIMISIGASEIEEKNCSEDCSNTESELCLGHTGEIRGQCTFTVKRSTRLMNDTQIHRYTDTQILRKQRYRETQDVLRSPLSHQ